jgi:hypothetical protein
MSTEADIAKAEARGYARAQSEVVSLLEGAVPKEREMAETRGYARGVEDAAKICADPDTPNSILVRYPGAICRELAARIRDLLGARPVGANNERGAVMADIGKIAYDAYAKSTGGLTYDGRVMPEWAALTDRIQQAWRDAAHAVLELAK